VPRPVILLVATRALVSLDDVGFVFSHRKARSNARLLVAAHAHARDVALINVFRVGPTPQPPPAESARLPAEELLLA
jgi:hypothetical protein